MVSLEIRVGNKDSAFVQLVRVIAHLKDVEVNDGELVARDVLLVLQDSSNRAKPFSKCCSWNLGVVLAKAGRNAIHGQGVEDALELVNSGPLLWSCAKQLRHVLLADVLLDGDSLTQLEFSLDDVGQIRMGHAEIFLGFCPFASTWDFCWNVIDLIVLGADVFEKIVGASTTDTSSDVPIA